MYMNALQHRKGPYTRFCRLWIIPNVWFYPQFENEGVGFRGRLLAPTPWLLFENFLKGNHLGPFGHLPKKGQLRGCNTGVMPKGQSQNLRVFDQFQCLSPLNWSVVLTPFLKTLEVEFFCQTRCHRGLCGLKDLSPEGFRKGVELTHQFKGLKHWKWLKNLKFRLWPFGITALLHPRSCPF